VSVVDIFKSQLHNLQAHTSYTFASLRSGTRTYTYAHGARSMMQIHIPSGRSKIRADYCSSTHCYIMPCRDSGNS